MQNKNYPLVKLQVDGDDLVLKQVKKLKTSTYWIHAWRNTESYYFMSIQFRFDYDEPKPTNDWVIPITLTSGAAYTTTIWMENVPETRVPGYISASNGSWILANQHQTGQVSDSGQFKSFKIMSSL